MSTALATAPTSAPSAALTTLPTSAIEVFSVPIQDLKAFSELPEARRAEVLLALKLLGEIETLRADVGITKAIKTVAARWKHAGRGLAYGSLRRKWDAYLASDHDWRSLVAGYKAPSQQPTAFVGEIRRACQLNHRSVEEALEQIRDRWAQGEAIKGYGTWRDYYAKLYPDRPSPKSWPRGFYPTGWSVSNLRRYGPSKASRSLALRGLAASKKYYSWLKRDPSQLRPMELLAIDDFELDCLCKFAGDANHRPQLGRVAGLLIIDVATRRKLHWGMGQRMEREEPQPDGTVKTVRTGISRLDMQSLLYTFFEKFGLPDYPVTILVERASASISHEMQLSIETLFPNVRIERTGMVDHKTLANGFTEKGGCPWEKGWVESAFNKLWNILGAQKGYKGSNQRLNAPGDLDKKIAVTKILLGHGARDEQLPPEVIKQLRIPFPDIEECERAFAWACQVADTRTKHRYLGFDRVTEFLLEEGGEPQPFEQLALLSPDEQLKVQLVERMESTVERWNRLVADTKFTVIPSSLLAVFLLTPKEVTYRNSAVTFTHQKEGFTYLDESGEVFANLRDGTELLGYFNPADPRHLHVTEINGSLTGTLTRMGKHKGMVDIRDKEALAVAGALQSTVFNRDVARVREDLAAEDAQLAADQEHNEAVIARHHADTAHVAKFERIAQAAGNAAATAVQTRKTDRALQKNEAFDATKLF